MPPSALLVLLPTPLESDRTQAILGYIQILGSAQSHLLRHWWFRPWVDGVVDVLGLDGAKISNCLCWYTRLFPAAVALS